MPDYPEPRCICGHPKSAHRRPASQPICDHCGGGYAYHEFEEDRDAMPDCPVCFGEGQHDHRDADAIIGEFFTEDQIRESGIVHPVGIVECEECGGTGVVTEERAKEIRAVALATIDRIIARAEAEGL